ncbi:hypothetical protein [Metapseudomonas resinovorans]|uniref:Uncharacterized protein n=1 Tax=Metapseudomonas resinovorans NBRC 106553 TaxID=1245471 RepID=S6BDW4_METRE|nr:hypothetical protein [Pseudomonas resinovorans]BAN47264.1 hypothetical protein PCA10_15320 [Pseudomonas resinovorans NBRC 106553]
MRRYVSLQSLILVKSREHDFVLTPTTAEDLASFGLRFLVAELGTEGARLFLRKKFSEYRPDYRGIGRDDGPARKDEEQHPAQRY